MMLTKRRVSSEKQKLSDQDEVSDDSSKRKHLNGDDLKSGPAKSAKVKDVGPKMNFVLCLMVFIVPIVIVDVYLSNRLQNTLNESMENISISINDVEIQNFNFRKPVVCMLSPKSEWPFLIHVREIFRRLGYEVTRNINERWDILWTKHSAPIVELEPHQKVNHFPGIQFVTWKKILSTSNFSFVPKSFSLPDDGEKFLNFSSKHPEYLWLKKNTGHKGVEIKRIEEIHHTNDSYIVQEFIQNPLLIDGRKFDIGIYVFLTSIDPLRVYTFDEEAQLRFCLENYNPFDSSNIKSYVIGYHYTPFWQMPSLNTSYVTNMISKKESFNMYLRSIGKDPGPLWKKMEDMIATVFRHNEMNMVNETNHRIYPVSTNRHFFEVTRFDFMIDEDLNPYLLESNLSPNLATPGLPQNQYMFEKVIYNILSLSGLARTDGMMDWYRYDGSKWNLRVHDRDLVVNEELCQSKECESSCGSDKCRSCFHCLSDEMKLHLKDAFLEQKSIWSAKRLLPSTSDDDLNSKTDNNKVQTDWFKAKCKSYPNWCSR